MEHFRIEDSRQAFEFDGARIAGEVSNRYSTRSGNPRSRWLTASLFRTKGGAYVLYRVNSSSVYHDMNAKCDPAGRSSALWTPCSLAKLDDMAVPCDRAAAPDRPSCHPPSRDTPGDAGVLCERDRPRIDLLPDAPSVIKLMSQAKHKREGYTSTVITDLMDELLAEAEEVDEAFRGPKPVTQIA